MGDYNTSMTERQTLSNMDKQILVQIAQERAMKAEALKRRILNPPPQPAESQGIFIQNTAADAVRGWHR
jgi:hypothetical protein